MKKNKIFISLCEISIDNGCRIYVDIMTGENCRQFRLQFPLAFLGRVVYLVGREGVVLKRGHGVDHYF